MWIDLFDKLLSVRETDNRNLISLGMRKYKVTSEQLDVVKKRLGGSRLLGYDLEI